MLTIEKSVSLYRDREVFLSQQTGLEISRLGIYSDYIDLKINGIDVCISFNAEMVYSEPKDASIGQFDDVWCVEYSDVEVDADIDSSVIHTILEDCSCILADKLKSYF